MAHGKYGIEAKKTLAEMKKAQRAIRYGQKKLVYARKLAYSYKKLIVSMNYCKVSSMGEIVCHAPNPKGSKAWGKNH